MKKLTVVVLGMVFTSILVIGIGKFGSDRDALRETAEPMPEPRPQSIAKAEISDPDVPADLGVATVPAPRDTTPAASESAHASDALVAASTRVSEQVSEPDAAGNFERLAILDSPDFKYPRLRMVEQWSGKSGDLVSRVVMVANHLLLAPKPDSDIEALARRLGEAGFELRKSAVGSPWIAAFKDGADEVDALPARIAAVNAWTDLVEFAEPDFLVWPAMTPADPEFVNGRLWNLTNPGTLGGYLRGADIDAPAAWTLRHSAPNVIVAVVDGGIRHDHEDLAPNLWVNPSPTVGDIHGYDVISGSGNPLDTTGHGTHLAGIIGARGNNNLGITGVAWQVKLMDVKFLSPLGGTTSDAITAIQYARNHGAHVINASWDGGAFSEALRQAIADCALQDIAFVTAAGNSGTDNDSLPRYPASYDCPNIISVAATDANDELLATSCFGADAVDLAAPGWQIWSCGHLADNDYQYRQGTSMAAAHVSGALALARAQFPADAVETLLARVRDSVDPLDSLTGKIRSGGRLNLSNLLSSPSPATNDLFAQPHLFTGTFGTWSGSNAGATREPGEDLWYGIPGERSLWFRWQPTFTGTVELNTVSLGADVRIAVYEGNQTNQLHFVADSASNNPSEPNLTKFLAQQGDTYRIVALSNSATGEKFSLSLTAVGRNDAITSSTTVIGESFSITDSNRSATGDSWEKATPHAGVGAGKSMWYRWEAPFSGSFTVNTLGSGFDTVLAVYQGNIALPWTMNKLAANDDAGPLSTWSACTFEATQALVYFIAVDSAQGTPGGTIRLNGLRPSPVAITQQPGSLTRVAGERAVFSVEVTGSAPFEFQWFRNGQAITGAVAATLTLDPVSTSDFATYHVTVGNAFASVTSANAALSESLSAPAIRWSSGDQTVAPGTATTLRIQASGSEPLTYQWSRGGVDIPGATSPSLTLSSPQQADAGAYRCTVSNTIGNARASFQLKIAGSPWQGWQWQRAEVPSGPITEMKVIENECFAVAGDRLFVSADAAAWDVIYLPQSFLAASMAKLGANWICTGSDPDGNSRVITSTDGREWSLPMAVTGVVPYSSEGMVLRQVLSFAGRFVGWNGAANAEGGRIHYSTNGIDWTPATATFLNSTTGYLSSPRRLVDDGTQMLVPGSSHARVLRSTNGMSWNEIHVADYEYSDSRVVYHAADGWHLHVDSFSRVSSHYKSPDGLNNWQTVAARPNVSEYDVWGTRQWRVVPIGNEVFWHSATTRHFAWGDPNSISAFITLSPKLAPRVSAAVAFQGVLVYGTNTGALGTADSWDDFQLPNAEVYSYSRLDFLNGEFIASGANMRPLFSGDGTHWQTGANLDLTPKPIIGFAVGRYYAEGAGTSVETFGFLPDGTSRTPTGSTSYYMRSIDDNGSVILAVSGYLLLRSADRGVTWTTVATPPFLNTTSQVMWIDGRWFLTDAAATANQLATPYIYHSADGLSWTPVNTVNASRIIKLGSVWHAIGNAATAGANAFWESSDGTTWSPVATTGLPDTFTPSKLLSFNESLVAFMNTKRAYYSIDGRVWLRADLPHGTNDIQTGIGKLVAMTSNGAAVTTGPAHPGGSAPLVEVTHPAPSTQHLLGSTVEITGSFSDPDGGQVTLTCSDNGVVVASQTTPGAFRFRIDVSNPEGHEIRLRAVDAAGLVSARSLRILSSSTQLPNLFTSSDEGVSFVNASRMVELNGALYAAGTATLWRSFDGGLTWQRVPVPSSVTGSIISLAAGNGALVLQLGPAHFATSVDGANWQAIVIPPSPNYSTNTLVPLRFESGWFVAGFSSGSSIGMLVFSQDGINWRRSLPSYTMYAATWLSIDEAGVVLTSDTISASQKGLMRSTDFGTNWISVPAFEGLDRPRVVRSNDLYLAFSGRRTWTSTDGIQWIERFTFAGNRIIHSRGDRFFATSDTNSSVAHISADGIIWQNPSGTSTNASSIVGSSKTGFIARQNGGTATVWSANGIAWQTVSGGPVDIRTALLRSDGFIAIDGMGAVWHSPNGTTWTKRLPGRSASTMTYADTLQQASLTAFGSGLLTGHTSGILHLSADDFSTWTRATLGGTAMPSNSSIAKVISNGTRALALISTPSNTAATGIFRTTNGIDWTKPTQPAATYTLRAIADNGSSLIAVGNSGLAWRSTDDGISWAAVTISGLIQGQAVAWFNSRWIVLGTDSATAGSPLKVFHSTNGTTWTKGNSIGVTASTALMPSLVSGHGRLVCSLGYQPATTTNGTTWTLMATTKSGGSTTLMDMAATTTGWLAVHPLFPGAEMWTAPPDGSAWTRIPPLQERVNGVENVGSRVFLLGLNFLSEWSELDYSIALSAAAPANLGVGDTLTCNAIIRNRGAISSTENPHVDAWLSKDGFHGDDNDLYLGRVPLGTALPPPGGETSVNLQFELPYTIRPGALRVIVKLDPESLLNESNRSNNLHVTPAPAVIIPGRRLDLQANGNGAIFADGLTELFPDKARVSLVAQPGKDSYFAGWAGDVPETSNFSPTGSSTPLNENLVILDADKTVIANFDAARKLTIATRGGGTVTLDAPNGLYQTGATATLLAAPLPGWTFEGWSGDLSSTNSNANLAMNADKSVTARFTMTREEWQNRSFTLAERADPDISGPAADPDADGIPNWREWLHGSNPKDPASHGKSPLEREDGVFSFRYSRMETMPPGHAIRAVATPDLLDWSLPLTERVIARSNGIETIEASFDSSTRPKAFFSIAAEQPAPESD